MFNPGLREKVYDTASLKSFGSRLQTLELYQPPGSLRDPDLDRDNCRRLMKTRIY